MGTLGPETLTGVSQMGFPGAVLGSQTITGTSTATFAGVTTVSWFGPEVFENTSAVDLYLPVDWGFEATDQAAPPYRLIVTDISGNTYGELENATITSPLSEFVNEMGDLAFSLPATDPKVAECLLVEREVQVWRGAQLVNWFVLVRSDTDGRSVRFQGKTLEWYFTRRVLGRVPKDNVLENGLFENGQTHWDFVCLPGTGNEGAPAHNTSRKRALSGGQSLMLAPSDAGKVEVVLDNDNIFTGTALTTAGENALDPIITDAFGEAAVITVEVYDDNQLARKASIKRAEARADAIADYIQDQKPRARVRVYGMGSKDPIATNTTSGGRDQNRRTVVSYNDNSTSKNNRGHKQCATQRVLYRHPSSEKRRVKATLSGWVYVKDANGWAYNRSGLVLELQDFRRNHPDAKWAAKGYNKVLKKRNAPISESTPLGRWVRLEVTLAIPPDAKKHWLEARLFPPNGTAWWDEVWLTLDEALHYSDDEQGDIIRDLVEHAQDEAMGKSDLNIDTNIQDTGVVRDRHYSFHDRTNIYELLSEFSDLADGMEWNIDVSPEARTFTTHYPRKGKETTVVLSTDSNILDYKVEVDGSLISSTVIIQAEGEGSDREERSVQDPTLTSGVVTEHVYDATPGSSISSLKMQAQRGLARYRNPVIIPSVVMKPEYTTELLNAVASGDRVTVMVDNFLHGIDQAGRYRITGLYLDPQTDSLSFDLFPEDRTIERLVAFGSTGWKYLNQAQGAITGSSNTAPVESNTTYAGRTFNDSGWSTGQAAFGWKQDGTVWVADPHTTINTTIPDQHEVWMRRTVKCTGDMYIRLKVDSFGWLYVNGNLVKGDYYQGLSRRGRDSRGPITVPDAFLDPSGDQVIAYHVQDRLADYNSEEADFLVADVAVYGTYDASVVA